MAERLNPAAQESAKADKETYLDSKSFQAANRVYQIEAQGGSVEEALQKDKALKALVDKAFEDKKWNPEGQTIEQTKFSQPDAAKTFKFGKPMTSWTDNPVARMWRAETPNADKILEEMAETPPTELPEKEKPHVVSPEEAKAAQDDREARAEQDKEKSEADAAKILETWMIDESAPQNLSEGGKQEGFARGTRREERAGFGGGIEQKNVGLPGSDFAELSAAARDADARGAKDLVDTTPKKPSLFSRLFGQKPVESKGAEVIPFPTKESKDDSEKRDVA